MSGLPFPGPPWQLGRGGIGLVITHWLDVLICNHNLWYTSFERNTMTGNGMTQSNQDLADRLRSRSRFHPLGGVDRKLMIGAAEFLGDDISLSAESVSEWLAEHNVTLLPWQKDRLGLEG